MLHIVDKDKEFPLLITTVVQAEPWEKGHIAHFMPHHFSKISNQASETQNICIFAKPTITII
jgi:hypothetical protein